MSSNIQQIYSANPAATLLDSDLFYLGRSPYSTDNDMAMQGSILKSQIQLGLAKTTSYAGNPNGNVAGAIGDFVTNSSSGNLLYYCTTAGIASTAVWTQISSKKGTVTLIAGVGVVTEATITANSRISYAGQDTGVTGFLNITARTAGTGFTLTSSVNTDAGIVAYEFYESV